MANNNFNQEGNLTLSAEQVERFQNRGAIYIPGVASSEEMSIFRSAINEAVKKIIRKLENWKIEIPMERLFYKSLICG